MPIKFRPTSRIHMRSGEMKVEHHYIKAISQKELFEELNKYNTKPKVKQKIRNELVRRGIKIVKRTQNGRD